MTKVVLDHLVSVEQLSLDDVYGLIERGLAFKDNRAQFSLDKQVFVSNLFFESSTRTHKSFEIAERKMGLEVVDFNVETSSVNKGETLYDTILTLNTLGVAICVIRHGQDDYYRELIESESIRCAIINGGDGTGQHPSQSLLDLMTIYEQFGQFEGLNIAISGDISHSRVARSNIQLLHRLGANLYFSGPSEWYSQEFDQYGQHIAIDDVIDSLDVLMLLRVQHERHDFEKNFSKDMYHQVYGLNQERYDQLKPQAIVMHPAPVNRDVEIADHLVEAEKSRIVRQMENGVYVRMAILEAILNKR